MTGFVVLGHILFQLVAKEDFYNLHLNVSFFIFIFDFI